MCRTLGEGGGGVVLSLVLFSFSNDNGTTQAESKKGSARFLDSVLCVAPAIVPRSRFATNDRSLKGGSVRRPETYAKPIGDREQYVLVFECLGV